MKSHPIHRTRHFELVSYGNGLAYVLEKLGTDHKSVLFQGDDADQFRQELDTLNSGRLRLNINDVLHILWNDYEAVAQVAEKRAKIRRAA